MAVSRERVLIAGGSGFVGANLARALISAGHDVHLLLRSPANCWRLAGLQGRFTAHRADLLDAAAVRRAVVAARPDVIYQLATHGVQPGQRDRGTILATNVLGTANLLEALEDQDYRAFVQAGSGIEYGPRDEAVPEGDCLRPVTDYAVGKAAASLVCQAEAARGRPVVLVRIFAAYGPWEGPERLTSYLMSCCLRGQRPSVSAGSQRRDFIAVADVVRLLQMAADEPRAVGQVLHAGTGREHSVRDMVETILRVCGGDRRGAEFGAVPLRPGEPLHYLAGIERTRALTGWEPRHDLATGIQQMWAWFQTVAARAA